MKNSGSVIVSWDFSKDMDTGVVIVGKQSKRGKIDVINALQGREAYDMINSLLENKKEIIKNEND